MDGRAPHRRAIGSSVAAASSQASRRTLRAECVDASLVRHGGRRIRKVVVWL